MLSTRAFFTGTIIGAHPPPPEPEEDDVRVVADLTRLSNYVSPDGVAFPFDTAWLLDTDYFTWAGEGSPLVCVESSWYDMRVNITTLGTSYGGANNSDYIITVGKNGLDLANAVWGLSHEGDKSSGAQLDSGGTLIYLETGDELDLYFINNVTGATSLLIESNPTDGPDYTTDVGPGRIGPRWQFAKVSGNAPSGPTG